MITISHTQVSTIAMVEGNEEKFTIVVCRGRLMEWVGIGWVCIREKATEDDHEQYPVVVFDDQPASILEWPQS